jgi:deoxyribonucleoside regulator
VICFGIGAVSSESVLVTSGYLSPREAEALIAKGAVGDILSRYINAKGEIVDIELDSRTIGLDLASCGNRELSIAVGTGRAKHAAILACLKARHINVLVTDEQAARYLMEVTTQ